MLPRRKACRAHAPLFEWTNVGCLQPYLRAPLPSGQKSKVKAHRLQALLPPLPVSVCLFCGGLGVGEKPTYGELVPLSPRRKSGRFSLTIGNLRKNLRSQLNLAFEVFFCRVDGDLF